MHSNYGFQVAIVSLFLFCGPLYYTKMLVTIFRVTRLSNLLFITTKVVKEEFEYVTTQPQQNVE